MKKKKLKIRFVLHKTKLISCDYDYYTIQKKNLLGCWSNISYTQEASGGSIIIDYTNKNKQSLLEQVLKYHFHTTKDFIQIIEYPEIIYY